MSTSRIAIAATTLTLIIALAGCVAESSDAPMPAATTPPASSPGPSTAAPSPTATTPTTALPDDCANVYSPQMVASLEADGLPLNDPGVTMYSTENAVLLEKLDVLPTLRCSWGTPSEVGLATNVTVVDAAQSAEIAAELAEAGYGCDTQGDATICRIEQRGVSLDDAPYTRGEAHALRGDLWIATAWLNVDPVGYTEDILATLGE